MREIKFRQWIGGSMVYWGFLEGAFLGPSANGSNGANAQNTPHMQYTGLHDKNGVEIYEGDIYKSRLNTKFPYTLQVVVWDELNQGFMPKMNHPEGTTGHAHLGEVIGNVYENPELISST